jgi:hypothetical protein
MQHKQIGSQEFLNILHRSKWQLHFVYSFTARKHIKNKHIFFFKSHCTISYSNRKRYLIEVDRNGWISFGLDNLKQLLWLLKFQRNSVQVLNFVSFILMITIKSPVLFIFNHNSHRNKTTLKYSGITDNGIKLTLIVKSKLLFHT